MIITFSGVDGAGKTTILSSVKQYLVEQKGYKVKELRHRPGLFPILSAIKHGKKKAELLTMQNNPRSGTNTSSLSSYLRFAYYFADYLIGQAWVFFAFSLRGYVIIYDRYYFDFIADPKRTNLSINVKLATRLYSLITKPDYNFFLYAPTATILSRKQELDAKSIEELTKNYLNLFEHLSVKYKNSKYLAIENIHLNDTLAKITSYID
jgi:thymidylate kinase